MANRADKIAAEAGELCAALEKLGCDYDWRMDNRGGFNSRYIFVRKPIAIKIRVSDHKSRRVERDKEISRIPVYDVGPHATPWSDAIISISSLLTTKV